MRLRPWRDTPGLVTALARLHLARPEGLLVLLDLVLAAGSAEELREAVRAAATR